MALLWKRQLLSNSSHSFVFHRQFKSAIQNLSRNGGSNSYLNQNSRLRRVACLLLGGTAISCWWWFQRPRPPLYLRTAATGILAPPTVHAKSKKNLSGNSSAAALSRLTPRERRFVQFASTEYGGQLYMTPQDFLESVIEAEPRPRLKRRILQEVNLVAVQKATPPLSKGSPRTFRDLGDQGIISYTEYLFLLSILTKPKSGFGIAFQMFDTDGNARVDKTEFLVLLGILCQKVFKEDILIRGIDRELLERIFSHAYRDRRGLRDEGEELRITSMEDGLVKRNELDTTLLLHLFGKKGKRELTYKEFSKFMENLQTEVLELEFLEFSKGLGSITELDFAKILLRYTQLDPDVYDEFLDRLIQSDVEDKGITFKEFLDFCNFLNNLEDFTIAMRMYSLADRPISEEEFHRAVKICTGASLSAHVVRTVFLIFDQDGDGRLSDREFIAIMKDRVHRGLQSYTRNEGWDAFKHCVKQEMKSVI